MDHRGERVRDTRFILLAFWSGAMTVIFAIGVLTWLPACLYRRSVGGDVFGDNDRTA